MNYKDFCVLILMFFLARGIDAMTKAQMKNTMKMLKTNCMKKIQVTEDLIGSISQGEFIEDKKVMCFIACIFEMTNVAMYYMDVAQNEATTTALSEAAIKQMHMKIKNNKLSYETSLKQIDMMYPPDLKDDAKDAVTKCKDVQKKYKDICEASFWTAKCMYEFKPEAFVFP